MPRGLYGNFLDAGIEIYKYRKSFLHAKVAVIERCWATVGSSNIDPFSLLLSRQANVVVNNEGFGSNLSNSLKQAVETDAIRIFADNWKLESRSVLLICWLSYGLVRLMMGISGYANENNLARNE